MEKELENWEIKIMNDYKNSNFSKQTLKTKERKLFVMYIVLTVFAFLIGFSTMISLIIFVCLKEPFSGTALGCVIGFSILFIICTMLFFPFKACKNHKLWWTKMSQLLGFEKYYKLVISEATAGKLSLIDISNKFKVAPWWPMNSKISYVNNDRILNMIYDEKIVISFGTVMLTEGSGKYQVSYSHSYLACEFLDKNFNVTATIKKSNIFNKITDNTDLESTIFEKIYYVNSNDQIEIRKLLTPKVIENLILMANNRHIPEMDFKDKFLVFSLGKQRVSLTNKCDNKLVCFNFKENPEHWAIELINTINHDLILLSNALRWLFCFDWFAI